MRRTLSVVLYIVTFYDVKANEYLSAIEPLANNTLRWNNKTISAFRTPLSQGIFPLLKHLLYKFQHSSIIKSVPLVTTPVSGLFRFDFYKPINKYCHETDAFFLSYHCHLLQC
jgi:hypothetical protein